MEIQHCECHLCEEVHKNIQPLVFNDLDTENPVPSGVCHEPDLTSSTSTLVIAEATSPDNTMDASTSTIVIDETISSDNAEVATIPTQLIDETKSPTVNQLFTRRSDRARKPIQKLNL